MEKPFSGSPFRRKVSPESLIVLYCRSAFPCKTTTTAWTGHARKVHPHAPAQHFSSSKILCQIPARAARADFSPASTRQCLQQQSGYSQLHAMHPGESLCCFGDSLYSQERPGLFQSS